MVCLNGCLVSPDAFLDELHVIEVGVDRSRHFIDCVEEGNNLVSFVMAVVAKKYLQGCS